VDLNHRPPGPEPGALARLRYAPTIRSDACLVPKREYQINIALQSPPDSLWTGFSNSRQQQTTSATNNVNYLLGKKEKAARFACLSI
jgi:hypothetical protein